MFGRSESEGFGDKRGFSFDHYSCESVCVML